MLKEYLLGLRASLDLLAVQEEKIQQGVELIASLPEGNYVWVCGNGGDAALANHFCCDLLKFAEIPAVSLCANEAILTMIGNDYGYERAFTRQRRLIRSGDIVFCLSTSGLSRNVLAMAHRAAEEIDARVISIVGPDHERGPLRLYSDLLIEVGVVERAPQIEDVQSTILHLLALLAGQRKGILDV